MDFGALLSQTWTKFIENIVDLVLFALVGFLLFFTIILIPSSIGGLTKEFLAFARTGKKPDYNELWSFNNYAQILLFCIVAGILIPIGFMLLIIPGVYLSIIWMYSVYYIVDKDLDFIAAMKKSRNHVQESGFFNHFVVFLIVGIIGGVGFSAAFFGSLLTTPFTMLFMALAYNSSKK